MLKVASRCWCTVTLQPARVARQRTGSICNTSFCRLDGVVAIDRALILHRENALQIAPGARVKTRYRAAGPATWNRRLNSAT